MRYIHIVLVTILAFVVSSQLAGGYTRIYYSQLPEAEQNDFIAALRYGLDQLKANGVIPDKYISRLASYNQIVAGRNWKFVIRIDHICTQPTLTLIVYQKLESDGGGYELTDFYWKTCSST